MFGHKSGADLSTQSALIQPIEDVRHAMTGDARARAIVEYVVELVGFDWLRKASAASFAGRRPSPSKKGTGGMGEPHAPCVADCGPQRRVTPFSLGRMSGLWSIGDLQDIVSMGCSVALRVRALRLQLTHVERRREAFLDMLGVFAEFETNLRRERQMEGIAAAKLKGVYKGRPASIDAAKVAALKAEGLGATEIAKRLKVGRAAVYRVLAS